MTTYKLPTLWIYANGESNERILNFANEKRKILFIGTKFSLVEVDLECPKNNTALGGLYHTVLISDIRKNDWEKIIGIESMSVEIYPNLNERLYLCCLAKKNVNPALDIELGKEIPDSYKTYVDIITGVVPLKDLGY